MNIDKRMLNFGLTIRYLLTLTLLDDLQIDSYKLVLAFFKDNVKDFIFHFNKIFITTKVNNKDYNFSLYYYLAIIKNIDLKVVEMKKLEASEDKISVFCETIMQKIKDLHVKEKENYDIITDVNQDPIFCLTVFRYGLTNELIDIIELSNNSKSYDELLQLYTEKAKQFFAVEKVISETYLDSYNYSATKNEDIKKRIKNYMNKQINNEINSNNNFEILKKLTEKLRSVNVNNDDISNVIYKIVVFGENETLAYIDSIVNNTSKIVSLCENIAKTNIQNSYQLQNLLVGNIDTKMYLYYGYVYKLSQRNTLSSIIDDTFENRSKIMINPLYLNKNNIIRENELIQLLQYPNLFSSVHCTENLVKDITNFMNNFEPNINIQNLITFVIKDIIDILTRNDKYEVLQLVSFIDFDGPFFENSFKYKFTNTLNVLDDEKKLLLFEDIVSIVLSYINFKKIKCKMNMYNIPNEETEKILEVLNKKNIKINVNICGFINEIFNYYKYDKEYYSPTVIRGFSYFFDVRNKNINEIITETDKLSFDEVRRTVISKLNQLIYS